MKKVYCALRGGFGNQLFQFVNALTLAEFYNAQLILDDGWFRGRRKSTETLRSFGLHWFDLPYRLPRQDERYVLALMDYLMKFQKRFRITLFPLHHDQIPLSTSKLDSSNCIFVHGSWQVYELMKPYRDRMRKWLDFPPAAFGPFHVDQLFSLRKQASSVAVHVRRGDYVDNPRASAAHGVCSLSYYSRALSLVVARVQEPHVYLFSDDIAWAARSLPLEGIRFSIVDTSSQYSPETAAFAEFDLMRHCRHAVIANSSFSWWAAFLLQTPQSLVIAPKQWYSWGSPSELYSPDWVLL